MSAIRTAHPLTTAAARALSLLADYQPTSPDDAAALLSGLHEHGSDCVISTLLGALHHLRETISPALGLEPEDAQIIADHLQAATELISGAATDWIDRARELLPEAADTSAYDGVPSWELAPASESDPHAAAATGLTMTSVPARLVREGDVIGGEHWRTVIHAHHDREDHGVYLTLKAPDGTAGSLEIVADAAVAVLRPVGPNLLATLTAIRNDAASLADRSALTQTVPARRILERTDALLNALSGVPALEG